MKKDFWDSDYLISKGLIFGGKYLPYNPNLKDRAKSMRKNITLSERKLWVGFLQKYNKRGNNKITIIRQKIIDNYIVDFYIPSLKIVIEINGRIHDNRIEYDKIKTEILEGYGLKEIRFFNKEILYKFNQITKILENTITSKVTNPQSIPLY